jgi:hypothetical protein
MEQRFSASELEKLTPQELAELLSNLVFLLRRLPNIPFAELGKKAPEEDHAEDLLEKFNQHRKFEIHE